MVPKRSPAEKDAESEDSTSDGQDSGTKNYQNHETPTQRVKLIHDPVSGRPRVAIQRDAPKTPIKLALRTKKPTITPTLSSPSRSQRTSSTPTKSNTTPQSSIKIKPVIKQAWAAPTIRSPAYHEQSLTRRRGEASLRVHKSSSKQSTQSPTIRYSVEELLSLRPIPKSAPGRSRHSILSGSDDSGQTVIYHDHKSQSNSRYVRNGVQSDFMQVLPERQNNMWRKETKIAARGTRSADDIWVHASEHRHQDESSEEVIPSDPAIQSTIVINRRTDSSTDETLHDQSTSVEDLESRIRSALSNRGRRSRAGSSRSVRSVRWDPAIVVESAQNPSNPLAHESGTASQMPGQTKTPRETAPLTASSSHEVQQANANKKTRDFYKYMKRITELKRGDRKKLLHLLEALTTLDTDDSSCSETEFEGAARRSRKPSSEESHLNPVARAFNSSSQNVTVSLVPNVVPPKTKGKIVRQGTRPNNDFDTTEPIWVKTSDLEKLYEYNQAGNFVAETHRPPGKQSQNHQSSFTNQSQGIGNFEANLDNPRQILHNDLPPQLHSIPDNQHSHLLAAPHPLHLPCFSLGHASLRRKNINPSLPIIDLSTGRIPSEFEHGREAQVVPWGTYILERFQERYPLTGRIRAEPPAPVASSHAAAIQERLEYLLMEQKERKALGQALTERGGNTLNSQANNSMYQMEKEVMKRLKSEIRRDEIERKAREDPSLNTRYKIHVGQTYNMPSVDERVSEATTCINSQGSEDFDATGNGDRLI